MVLDAVIVESIAFGVFARCPSSARRTCDLQRMEEAWEAEELILRRGGVLCVRTLSSRCGTTLFGIRGRCGGRHYGVDLLTRLGVAERCFRPAVGKANCSLACELVLFLRAEAVKGGDA